MIEIKIDTEFIKLDSLLKLSNLVQSGGEAKILIQEGKVKLNGETENRRGKKIHKGDIVEFDKNTIKVV